MPALENGILRVNGGVTGLASGGGGRVRVLHFVSTFAVKTDTKWLVQIARYLDRGRFELRAACFYGGGPIREELEDLGVKTHNLETPGSSDPRAVVRARRVIDGFAPDVVHTHLLRADLYGGLAARWSGCPIRVTTAYALGDTRRATRRRTDVVLDAVCRRLPTHVLAVCDAVRRDCVERLGFPAERVHVIRTGVDPPERPPGRADVERVREEWDARGRPLIVTAARLSYEKGVDILIDAAAVLRGRRGDVRVVVVGDGPERSSLEERIERHGLGQTVRLAGFRTDVWTCLSAADAVCLPSLGEGMPNVLLEAMALGRPIVATRVGGVPEAIEDGRSGVLVRAGDAGALADGLERVLGSSDAAAELGRAARAEVERRFLARDVVAEYGRWYQSLSRQPSRRN